MDVLKDPFRNKAGAFSVEERQAHGLTGLVPAGAPRTQAQGVELAMAGLRRIGDDLAKYEYLLGLLDRDARLFFAALAAHTAEIVPLVYTPVVGRACLEWHKILAPARGLYVSLNDAGRVRDVLRAWPNKGVRAIVVTDGGRILGLGDLGANGMGIPVGKLALYSGLAGVDPSVTLPVNLDVGTDNKALLADPHYLGLRRPREYGQPFYDLVDEFVHGVIDVFGRDTLLQWEDFGNTSAFTLLEKYKHTVPSFNDDIEGTASVVVAGLMSAAKHVPGVPRLPKGTYLFFGAGEAGVGIADLLAYSITLEAKENGLALSLEEARSRIWLVDSRGLVTAERMAAEGESFAHHKRPYAHPVASLPPAALGGFGAGGGLPSLPSPSAGGSASPGASPMGPVAEAGLAGIVRAVRPTALIGVSAQPATFTKEVVEAMVASAEAAAEAAADSAADGAATPLSPHTAAPARPVIFALSNPTSKAECTARQAYEWSAGKAVFASGSPFDPVTMTLPGGKEATFVPGQGNNAYIFPAVGLAALSVRMSEVPLHSMHVAAEALSRTVDERVVQATGCLYPDLADILAVSAAVATAVAEDAYDRGIAQLQPKPADMAAHMRASMWSPKY